MWLIPAWFAILGGAAVIVGTAASSTGQMPLWLGGTELAGLLIAACTALCVCATVRHHAFRADARGIWLGVRTARKHPKLRQVHLAWSDVAQLKLFPRRYGVLVEIAVSPGAAIVRRPSPSNQALLWLGALAMPGFGRGMPALTTPTADPPRYQVKICDRTAAELKLALVAIKPEALPVRVVTTRTALRFTVPPPGKPYSRPPTPVA